MARHATVHEQLAHYAVGAKVRRLRLRRKISLVDLARHTSLSAALLSKLERGRVTPTLPTLIRIALVFGVGLDHFFVDEPESIGVVRRNERLRFPEIPGGSGSRYEFEALDFSSTDRDLNAYLAEFSGGDGTPRLHVHDAAEFLYVLTGELCVETADGDLMLAAGDAIYIASGVRHGYRRASDDRCEAIVVTAASP